MRTPTLAHPLTLIHSFTLRPFPDTSTVSFPPNSSSVSVLIGVTSRTNGLDVTTCDAYARNEALFTKLCASNSVELGCRNTLPLCVKNLMVRASGSSSLAPDSVAAYFLSGMAILAICGWKAAATTARRKESSLPWEFRDLYSVEDVRSWS